MSQFHTGIVFLAFVLYNIAPVMADDLRVMSFNIRYGTANDGKDAWPKRQELVLRTITAHKPDLLGTQEIRHFRPTI